MTFIYLISSREPLYYFNPADWIKLTLALTSHFIQLKRGLDLNEEAGFLRQTFALPKEYTDKKKRQTLYCLRKRGKGKKGRLL